MLIISPNVNTHVVGWLLIGSIPGVLIGSHWSVRVPEHVLRFTLANVLALSGLKLVKVPNVWLAVALGLAAVSVVLMLWRGHRNWRARRRLAQAPV